VVQVDGAGSDSLVDPGVACWVGISGAPEAREERGLSAWQFAVLARSKAELQLCPRSTFSPCPLGGDFGYPAHSVNACVSRTLRLARPNAEGLQGETLRTTPDIQPRTAPRVHTTHHTYALRSGAKSLSANPGRHPQRVDPAQVHALAALELLMPWWVHARVGWMVAVHVIVPCDTHASQLGESHRTPGLGDGTTPRRRPSGARRQV
jgi:hypothetical protein